MRGGSPRVTTLVPHSPSGSTLQVLPDFGTWVGHPYKNNEQDVMPIQMQKLHILRRPNARRNQEC